MKKIKWKKEYNSYLILFFLLLFVHYPIISRNLLTADVLLNNAFYNGYAWEISLGRFGLMVIGILKGYMSYPVVDTVISFLLILMITYCLIRLFGIKEKIPKAFVFLLMALSPIVSSTLLFHYCSIGYFIAFLCGILSVLIYYEAKNKYIKYIAPIVFIVISLSMYQAYLSLIVTVFMLYQIKLLLNQKMNYKQSGIYFLLLIGGVLSYFICMKLSQFVFHIDMASYSNANRIGISTLLQIPNKFIESYRLFFEMYFGNTITKNTYLWNPILYTWIGVIFLVSLGIQLWNSKMNWKEKVLVCVLVLLIPVFLNSVIFVIADAKLQLLMSASYLVFLVYLVSFSYPKKVPIVVFILFGILLRNYFIQDQATYLTLDHTYQAYKTVIGQAIQNNYDKKFITVGEIHNNDTSITNYNYGYISDDGIFWDEYHLRKLGFERFCSQAFGVSLSYGDESVDLYARGLPSTDVIYEFEDTIIINLSSVGGETVEENS